MVGLFSPKRKLVSASASGRVLAVPKLLRVTPFGSGFSKVLGVGLARECGSGSVTGAHRVGLGLDDVADDERAGLIRLECGQACVAAMSDTITQTLTRTLMTVFISRSATCLGGSGVDWADREWMSGDCMRCQAERCCLPAPLRGRQSRTTPTPTRPSRRLSRSLRPAGHWLVRLGTRL